MKKIIGIILLICALMACQLRKFSKGNVLINGLNGDLKCIQENSIEIAKSYKYFGDSEIEYTHNLRKFDDGMYMVRMIEEKVLLNDEIQKIKYSKKREITKNNNLKIVKYKFIKSIDPSFSDKLIYIIFLDNNRVLYHSPYRKNYAKLGHIEKVNLKNIPKFNKAGTLKMQKKYARKTMHYFKLGDVQYDYNSTMRGYYKIKNDTLMMWFEREIDKKGIRLLRMDFLVNKIDIETGFKKFDNLTFFRAMINNNFVKLDTAFNTNSIKFDYTSNPFRLLLAQRKKENKLEMLIVKKIIDTNNVRTYKVLTSEKLNRTVEVIEKLDSIYTF